MPYATKAYKGKSKAKSMSKVSLRKRISMGGSIGKTKGSKSSGRKKRGY